VTENVTVSEGGFTVTSSGGGETAEQISAILTPEGDKPDTSEAASILGKKGGEAAAAKRAEAAKEAKTQTEAEPAVDAEPDKPVEEKPLGKPRDDPRARMLEATRQAAEAKREAQRERAERERLAAEVESLRAGAKPAEAPKAPPGDDPEPQEGDFTEYRDYVKAAARWEYKQAQKEAAKEAREQSYNASITAAQESFIERMDKAEADDPTFNEKVRDVALSLGRPSFHRAPGEKLTQNHVIMDELINSEIAPSLMLHFVEHPDELQRIRALRTPNDVQFAMARLEGRLEAKRQDAVPQAPALRAVPSQAKPPVRPVAGSPHSADSVPGADASYEDHKRYWSAKDKASARR
jgi:hypothetical protein